MESGEISKSAREIHIYLPWIQFRQLCRTWDWPESLGDGGSETI